MHLSIGVLMGLYLFALIMLVLNLAAFGPGLTWARSFPSTLALPSASCPDRTNEAGDMAGQVTEFQLEIAHILFIDTVGYSKLVTRERQESQNLRADWSAAPLAFKPPRRSEN